MRSNLQFPPDLVTFIEEIHNEKLDFLWCVYKIKQLYDNNPTPSPPSIFFLR